MTLSHVYDGSTLVGRVDLAEGVEGWSSSGDYGQNGIGSATIDDPLGNLTVVGWRTFSVLESACSIPDIFRGLTFRRPVLRMDAGTGNARQWDTDLVDLNVLLGFKKIKRSDPSGKRPAENDLQRLAWLLESGYMTDLHDDIPGIVATSITNLTDNPINFGEADYRGRTPLEVVQDIAGISGKRFGVRWDPVGAQATLFYDLASSTIASSTLRISNDPADEDADTFAPVDQISFVRSPEDLYDAVHYNYKSESIYRRREATHTEFKIHRDGSYDTDRVGRLATAEDQAAAWLVNHSGEIDSLEVTILLPPDKVNLVREFDRIEVKIGFLPGYESFTWLRVLHRVVGFEGAGTGLYRVKLELDITKLAHAGGGGSGGGFPYVCSGDPFVRDSTTADSGGAVDELTIDVPTHQEGDLLLVTIHTDEAPVFDVPTGWQQFAEGGYFWRFASPSEPADYTFPFTDTGGPVEAVGIMLAIPGIAVTDPIAGFLFATVANATTQAVPALDLPDALYFLIAGDELNWGQVAFTPPAGYTLAGQVDSDFASIDGTSAALATKLYDGADPPSVNFTTDVAGANPATTVHIALLACRNIPPLPGQPVSPMPPTGDVDGSNTDYVAPFPFSDGSQRFLHDGIDQTAHVASYNGETGAFTLDYAPRPGSTLRIGFLGR